MIEALAQLAPPSPVRSLREDRQASTITESRTCYDHLAGRSGVELRDRLLATSALRAVNDRDHMLTGHGRHLLAELEIDPDDLQATRRVLARSCIDWTSRRPHLAGALPAAITGTFIARGWLLHTEGRGLRVAGDYDQLLDRWLASAPNEQPK